MTILFAFDYHLERLVSEKELSNLKKHPYSQKGMLWLRENIMEVLDFYEKRKPGKQKLFEELKNEQSTMWAHCIPVYSSLLRTELPGEKGTKNFKLKVNTHFKSIIRLVNAINDIDPDDYDYSTLNSIDIYLAGIQKEIDQVFDTTFKDLTDKTGVITSKVLGGRYNFSSRNIIVPDSGNLRADEVIIGYIPFLELFRYEIQNEYRKLYGCTPAQANTAWKRACNHFDPKIYAIIEHMLNDPEYKKYLCVIVNRNPSINYGSFDFVRIVGVKRDIADKTLTIPTSIITPMNADLTNPSGSDTIVILYKYLGERLTSGVYNNIG